jgi:hypothetical protein
MIFFEQLEKLFHLSSPFCVRLKVPQPDKSYKVSHSTLTFFPLYAAGYFHKADRQSARDYAGQRPCALVVENTKRKPQRQDGMIMGLIRV